MLSTSEDLIKALRREPARIAVLNASSPGNGGHPYTAVCAELSEKVEGLGSRKR